MAHQLVNVHPAPRDNGPPIPLTLEQVLQNLFVVVPHMPRDSQLSFLTMVIGPTSSLSSDKALRIPAAPSCPLVTLDILRDAIKAKTYVYCFSTFASFSRLSSVQQLRESDSAFEAKQSATEKASKRLGGSKGITKRYQKRAPRFIVPSGNANTIPYGAPWSIGDAPALGNHQVAEAISDFKMHWHHWDSKGPSSSLHTYSPL